MKHQIKKFDRAGNPFPSFLSRYINDDFFNNFIEGDLPATNVKENEKAFNIEISVPGFSKEDIQVEIEKNVLKISAHTESKKEEKGEDHKILRQEFRKSSFSRSFTIPENIDTEQISATQKDGVLAITLPKHKNAIEDKVKKIDVK